MNQPWSDPFGDPLHDAPADAPQTFPVFDIVRDAADAIYKKAADAVASDPVAIVRRSVIGDGAAVETPYGTRRLTYMDVTASGRPLAMVEDAIRKHVMPFYGNVHTETTATGAQTTAFREEARAIIREAVNATREDAVIFCGSGATAAVNKLVDCLNFQGRTRAWGARPVVFVGPMEHHSNDLPWRESFCDVVRIRPCPQGRVDLDDLQSKLIEYEDRPLKIGSFTAASNVTGTLSNVPRIATMLHHAGALAFFDYAAAAPYVDIDMNPADDPLGYMDACFISPHKFPGGPGTPGVLVAKRRLFGEIPSAPGGGTVSYVDHERVVYSTSLTQREEAGTPDILGSIRAGLVFKLKQEVGVKTIREREESFVRRAIEAWSKEPNLILLGNLEADRLGVVSFVVKHGSKAVHHGLVAALLNDLFGIQARSGTSCAGPYGHYLLKIGPEDARALEEQVTTVGQGIRPGWTRTSFAYYDTDETVDFVIEAVRIIARDGWRATVDYTQDPATGVWKHRGFTRKLADLKDLSVRTEPKTLPESARGAYLEEAKTILAGCRERCRGVQDAPPPTTDWARMAWYWSPGEIALQLR